MVMPLGLCNTPATFQKWMNLAFADVLNEFLRVYFNGILVYSEIQEANLAHLRKGF